MVTITAVFVTQPMRASVDNLVITETSPTALTATFGSIPVTVKNTGPDQWTLTIPATMRDVSGK
jgi:hypothetical protein